MYIFNCFFYFITLFSNTIFAFCYRWLGDVGQEIQMHMKPSSTPWRMRHSWKLPCLTMYRMTAYCTKHCTDRTTPLSRVIPQLKCYDLMLEVHIKEHLSWCNSYTRIDYVVCCQSNKAVKWDILIRFIPLHTVQKPWMWTHCIVCMELLTV